MLNLERWGSLPTPELDRSREYVVGGGGKRAEGPLGGVEW
jgi:hypothetical protein